MYIDTYSGLLGSNLELLKYGGTQIPFYPNGYSNSSPMTMPFLNFGTGNNQYSYINNPVTDYQKQLKEETFKNCKTTLEGNASKVVELNTQLTQKKKDLKKIANPPAAKKLGFWEGAWHVVQGIGKSVPKMLGMEWDSKGKFKMDWGKCLGTLGMAAGAIALGVVGGPLVAGALTLAAVAGGAMAVTQGIKGGMTAFNGKTKEEQIKGCEDLGDAIGQLGLCVVLKKFANAKNAKNAKNLASELEGVLSKTKSKNIDRASILEEIENIRNSGGKSRKIQDALKGIDDLTQSKNPNARLKLNERVTQELEGVRGINTKTPLVKDVKFAKAIKQNEIINELNGLKGLKGNDPQKIQAIIDKINSATDRKAILQAIEEARDFAKGKNITYLLNKAQRVLETSVDFGTILKSTGTNIINTPVKVFNGVIRNPEQAVFTGYIAPRLLLSVNEQNAEAIKEAEENSKISDAQGEVDTATTKLETAVQNELKSLLELIDAYNAKQTDSTKLIKVEDIMEVIKEKDTLQAKMKKVTQAKAKFYAKTGTK